MAARYGFRLQHQGVAGREAGPKRVGSLGLPRPQPMRHDAPVNSSAPRWQIRLLSSSVAAVWLATGVLVLHPAYRAEGLAWLDRTGLPPAVMWGTCGGEVLLGLRVLLGPPTRSLAVIQTLLVAGFSVILATLSPMLLASPYGVLTKNLPLLAALWVATGVSLQGWTPRLTWLLRGGMAIIWVTEGLVPKILFQQPAELAVVAGSGLVPIDPGHFLVGMGLAQISSGVLALLLPARPLQLLLALQIAALLVLPVLVGVQDPSLWTHPFGPLTKNLPIIAGHVVLLSRVRAGGPR